MQQQQPQMIPVMPSFPPSNITTEQIQKYLDENKKLILAILENQNLGKIAECSQYQALLQKNLMYLAAIADAQPPTPTMPPQMSPHNAMPIPPGYFMQQHPQVAAMAQQPGGGFPQKLTSSPMQFNSPHQLQDPHHQQLQQHQQQQQQQQQQIIQGQMGMRNNGMHPMHTDTTLGVIAGGSGSGVGPSPVIGNKHDALDNTDGQGNSGAVGGNASGDGGDEAK